MWLSTSSAGIIKDEKYITGSNEYSFQEVCHNLVKGDSPLIDAASVSKLNCMGRKVEVAKFCDEKEAGNPYYIRAFIDKESKKVKCLSAKRVILHHRCEPSNDKYCEDSEVGCFLYKEQLAKRLKVAHQSISDDKILKCYFDVRVNMNLDSE